MREYAWLVATALLLGCGSDSNKVGPDEEEVAGTVTAELADGVTMDFVWIEPGTFTMGAPSSESGRGPDEGPQHEVTISRGFYLGKYELTQAQWEAVVGSNPSAYKGVNQPVETVSWDDVQTFIQRLNETAGAEIYRLPTEAEWEYACRAGSTTRWPFGDDESQLGDYAWYGANDNPSSFTKDVGQKLPNPWGLYDMHGNVWEWVQDWYDDYSSSAVTDPTGPSNGSGRVFRGGYFNCPAQSLRSAYRGRFMPSGRYDLIGVRLLRTQ